MFGEIACPISTVTAREILLPLLPANEAPDLVVAVELSTRLMQERGMYATVSFILDVWAWREQHGQG